VAGIMPALKADNGVSTFRQPVYDLAFTLVAPLSANYGYIRHQIFPVKAR
jgi:hypothetical protein